MTYLYLLPSYKHFLTIMLPQINKNEIKNNHHKKLLPTGLGLFCTQTCVRNAVPESDLFGICDCNSISNVNFTVEMNFGCIYFDTDYYTQSANFGTQWSFFWYTKRGFWYICTFFLIHLYTFFDTRRLVFDTPNHTRYELVHKLCWKYTKW